MADHGVGKAAAAHRLHPRLHQACQVVGDLLVGDGGAQALGDQVSGLLPAHVFEHHHAAEDHRTGVDAIQAGVLWRCLLYTSDAADE